MNYVYLECPDCGELLRVEVIGESTAISMLSSVQRVRCQVCAWNSDKKNVQALPRIKE